MLIDQAWYVRTPEGEEFGPVDRKEMEDWLEEGRLDEECAVRADDWKHWQRAHFVFPDLQIQAQRIKAEKFAVPGITDEQASTLDDKAFGKQLDRQIPGLRRVCQETGRWNRTTAIVGFLLSGVIAILAVFVIVSGLTNADAGHLIGIGLTLLVGSSALILWPAWQLLQYANALATFVEKDDAVTLQRAMESQLALWKNVAFAPYVLLLLAAALWYLLTGT